MLSVVWSLRNSWASSNFLCYLCFRRWRCPAQCLHSMQSRVYTIAGRPSVCPINRQQQRRPEGLLLSDLEAGGINDSCGRAASAVVEAPALSNKCGQRHVESRRRRLNRELLSCFMRNKWPDKSDYKLLFLRETAGLSYWVLWSALQRFSDPEREARDMVRLHLQSNDVGQSAQTGALRLHHLPARSIRLNFSQDSHSTGRNVQQ